MDLQICKAWRGDRMINWDDLRLLLAVSRRGSFLKAADMLGVAASTLSRRMTQFERAVGEPLVERGVEGVRLTPRGAALVETARALELELLADTRDPGDGLSGTVTVSAGDGFIDIVTEATRDFLSLHPGCTVDFLVENTLVKVARGAADVAIRTVHLGEPSLVYRRLASLRFDLFASPAFTLAAGAGPQDVPMIDLLPPLDQLPHLRAARAAGYSKAVLRVSSFSAQLAAVRAGIGAAVLPQTMRTGLAQPFAAPELPMLDAYLVTRPQALNQPQVRAFVDLLTKLFKARMMEPG
jgi:DNA-binding transcriptional LysR family regulator